MMIMHRMSHHKQILIKSRNILSWWMQPNPTISHCHTDSNNLIFTKIYVKLHACTWWLLIWIEQHVCTYMTARQLSMLFWHLSPCVPRGHEHTYPASSKLWQVPPLWHGSDWHESTGASQVLPVHPGSQVQVYPFTKSSQYPVIVNKWFQQNWGML